MWAGTATGADALALRIRFKVLTMWRQPTPERLNRRRGIRQEIEQLLYESYESFRSEGVPPHFVGLIYESDFMEPISYESDFMEPK
jgi:hypothetical protein